MLSVAEEIEKALFALSDPAKAKDLMRFFKTGKGQYGEGDKFLGVRVPETRAVVRKLSRHANISDADTLTASPWHEIRLAGFLVLVGIYHNLAQKGESVKAREATEYYISAIHRGNNWDLVDLVAPKILGHWLIEHSDRRDILYSLASMDGRLWHQRVAIVATHALIRNGEFDDTFRITGILMTHPHDLIHKACGWMLREVGKHGGEPQLLSFLDRYTPVMPRTMLRYAIERLPEATKRHYMSIPHNTVRS